MMESEFRVSGRRKNIFSKLDMITYLKKINKITYKDVTNSRFRGNKKNTIIGYCFIHPITNLLLRVTQKYL